MEYIRDFLATMEYLGHDCSLLATRLDTYRILIGDKRFKEYYSGDITEAMELMTTARRRLQEVVDVAVKDYKAKRHVE